METERVTSSGGLVFRRVNGQLQVALVSVHGVWLLPKGIIEPGETVEEAALREVKEETGLEGEIVKKLGKTNYDFIRDKHYFKTVHFFLLRYTGGSKYNHDSEVDKVKWFSPLKALQVLIHNSERGIVRKAIKILGG